MAQLEPTVMSCIYTRPAMRRCVEGYPRGGSRATNELRRIQYVHVGILYCRGSLPVLMPDVKRVLEKLREPILSGPLPPAWRRRCWIATMRQDESQPRKIDKTQPYVIIVLV